MGEQQITTRNAGPHGRNVAVHGAREWTDIIS
jgi:hypothetical protein